MFKNNLKRFFENERIAVPLAALFLTVLSYGLLAPRLGFYWDDQPFAWFLKFFGPVEFIEAFRPYRPLLGPIFTVTTALLGGHPFAWQLAGLAARTLLSIALWQALRLTWPFEKWNVVWVVLLFAVYPGFQQQWVALTHVNQELIPLLFLISSFAATAASVRSERRKTQWTLLALVLQIPGLFATEYFFGLEILRFFFLLIIFAESFTERKDVFHSAAKRWLPYAAVWALNAAWTYWYHQSAAYDSYQIRALEGGALSPLNLVNEIINAVTLSGFAAWARTFSLLAGLDGTLTQLAALALLLVAGVSVFAYMRATSREAVSDAWSWQAMLLGLVAILAGRLPSWAAGLPLKLEFDYDRLTLPLMLGASLFTAGLASFLLKEGKRKTLLLSLLVGLAVARQFSVSNSYRRDWENQREFFWQLAWRIPAMEPGTALLTYELPIQYASDMQMTALLNWAYAPRLESRQMPHVLIYAKSRYHSKILPSYQPDTPISFDYRTVAFNGSTSKIVVIYKEAGGCLRVLDSTYAGADTVFGASYFLTDAIRLSNPDLIRADAPPPQMDDLIFGKEPARNWCYFYEKAELARQTGDWNAVADLYRQARRSGFSPSLPVEYLPFIEAFARVGETPQALELTASAAQAQKELCPALSALWARAAQSAPLDLNEANAALKKNGCKP